VRQRVAAGQRLLQSDHQFVSDQISIGAFRMHAFVRRLSAFVFFLAFITIAHAAPVLMISIDGLKPEYITQADAHGMKIPFLRALIANGTYADGVIGIFPTVTYPSHTTLITGVWPAEHGIYNNLEFDPYQRYSGAWNWYAPEIRVPTLWSAAHQAGLRTASIGWPVSVGATDVDYLIPEYWRSADPSGGPGTLNPADRLLMAALSRPANLMRTLEPAAGPYMMGNDTSIDGDETKTRYAIEILHRYKPSLLTLHLSSLDEMQHAHGPFSPEACADLEALDGQVKRLAEAARAANPDAVLVLVSDHGFMRITSQVNLYVPFIQAGLINASVSSTTKAVTVNEWKAEPWGAGGMAAIMLRDSGDKATEEKVRALLTKLAADPDNGIAQVLDRAEIAKRGAFPDAAFLVVFKKSYYFGSATSGDLVTPISGTRGSHGFSPEYPEMHSSFFAMGAGIAQHRDLGVIDMRQIAPTVAHILNVQLPTAKATPLKVQP
jgi:predicted AlkP superfamily pyrophosphatase or phosphodiesterase